MIFRHEALLGNVIWLLSVFELSAEERGELLRAYFEEHYGVILAYFRRHVGPTISEDLSQETFVRAFRALDGFRGDAQPRTWLLRIAGNVWRNYLRDRSADKRSAEEVSLDESHHGVPTSRLPADEMGLVQERRQALFEAIQELPFGMQRCVMLRVYQDMSFKEIAAIGGISVGSAKSQVSLARAKLAQIMGDRFPELFDAWPTEEET